MKFTISIENARLYIFYAEHTKINNKVYRFYKNRKNKGKKIGKKEFEIRRRKNKKVSSFTFEKN